MLLYAAHLQSHAPRLLDTRRPIQPLLCLLLDGRRAAWFNPCPASSSTAGEPPSSTQADQAFTGSGPTLPPLDLTGAASPVLGLQSKVPPTDSREGGPGPHSSVFFIDLDFCVPDPDVMVIFLYICVPDLDSMLIFLHICFPDPDRMFIQTNGKSFILDLPRPHDFNFYVHCIPDTVNMFIQIS
jgi:hypothetical protein